MGSNIRSRPKALIAAAFWLIVIFTLIEVFVSALTGSRNGTILSADKTIEVVDETVELVLDVVATEVVVLLVVVLVEVVEAEDVDEVVGVVGFFLDRFLQLEIKMRKMKSNNKSLDIFEPFFIPIP